MNTVQFQALMQPVMDAIKAGWKCAHGDKGLHFGRVIKPALDTHGLGVDVLQLTHIVRPHHSHPTGEVCMAK